MSDGYQYVNNDNIIKSNSSQKRPLLAPLMYSLYGHPKYFKFKLKYQQYGPCFQTNFPFLMIMITFIWKTHLTVLKVLKS